MLRIAVMVSGGGTNLQALIDAQGRGEIPHGEIVCVVSNKQGAGALDRAAKAGIPSFVCRKADYPDTDARDDALLEFFRQNKVDVVVLAGYLAILTEKVIRQYPNRIINIHPSLIPSFCGMGFYGLRVHEAALAAGVKVTGATVHFVNEVADGGAIIAQKPVMVADDDTPESLQLRVMEQAEWQLLPYVTEQLCAGNIEVIDGKAYIRDERKGI
ncbi:MAG: phosphoribosylglycinamide formyltransferase [Ruminococcaceae bacterium]|nr:phosphoribosylglycinamide formyltransferase [Oscillospiraceae bacterium]